jgi:SAM-dependent methyltransferase
MSFESLLRERGADDYAGFFRDHLRPSDRVLDCGCGAGSITVGLARDAPAGLAVGIDRDAELFGGARAYAHERGLTNLAFCAADMTRLPFAAASYSAAFCHSALETLADPVAGLVEMGRVLEPGGLIGVACVEYEGVLIAGPDEERLRSFYALRERLWRAEGVAEPRLGKHLRSLLHRAGFERVAAHLAYVSHGTDEAVAAFGRDRARECRAGWLVQAAARHRLIEPARLDEMADAWEEWGRSPDALFGFTWARAVGRRAAGASVQSCPTPDTPR